MLKKNFFRITAFLLTFIVGAGLLAFLVYQEGPSTVYENLTSFGVLPFVGFVFISLLNFSLYSLRWQTIINSHLPKEKHVPLRKVFFHRMTGFAVSYLTPAAQVGGEPARIAMLVTDKVPIKEATSSVVLDIAFEMSAYIIFIVAGALLAVFQGFGGNGSFTVIFIGLGLLLLTLFTFFWAMARGKGFFSHLFRFFRFNKIKRFQKADHAIIETEKMMKRFLSGHPMRLFYVASLSVIVISFRVVEVFYIGHFLGVAFGFSQAFLLSTLPGIALLIPVPAGLGIFEGSFSAIFSLLNVSLSAVAFALIIRMRDVIFIFTGVVYMMIRGREYLEKKVKDLII